MKAESVDILAEVLLTKGSTVPFRITGESMSPTISLGDRVLVKKAAAADLSIGDIALIRSGDTYVTHRFFGPAGKVGAEPVRHKGDRGRRFDAVPAAGVLGKVTEIEKAGGARLQLDRPIWRLANLLIGFYHYTLVRAGRRVACPYAPKEAIFNALVRIPNGLASLITGAGRRA